MSLRLLADVFLPTTTVRPNPDRREWEWTFGSRPSWMTFRDRDTLGELKARLKARQMLPVMSMGRAVGVSKISAIASKRGFGVK